MSGLEPLAALGLACNILQIVEVGRQTIELIRTVYQYGRIDDELDNNAAALASLAAEVKKLNRPGKEKFEKLLLESANKCCIAAHDLREEVRYLCEKAKQRSVASLVAVLRAVVWRKNRLNRHRKELDQAEDRMQKSLLAHTWALTRAAGIDLRKVKGELRFFIEQYRQGHRATNELVSLEGLRTRDHVSREAKQTNEAVARVDRNVEILRVQSEAQADDRSCERFLQSLKYPQLNARRNQVADAYIGSLKWVFFGDNDSSDSDDSSDDSPDNEDESDEYYDSDDSFFNKDNSDKDGSKSDGNLGSDQCRGSQIASDAGDHLGNKSARSNMECNPMGTPSVEGEQRALTHSSSIRWNSFSNWLSSTDPIYWISGKPGSGKTTLVKYILANGRTREYLNIWSPGCEIISHYFWRPGTPMQKNLDGLYCSLLYQLLDSNAIALRDIMSVVGPKDSHTDWSSVELRSALLRVLDSRQNAVCLFLDGIDEIDPEDGSRDGIPEFLDLVCKLAQGNKTKLCLASRPAPKILEERLSSQPRLRLQDLNHQDLMQYARGKVDVRVPQWLIEMLVDRAEGVFLWLILAIKSINEGACNEDNSRTLLQRIDLLPKDLDSLYQDMWQRAAADSPPGYRQTAALYFKLLFRWQHNEDWAGSILGRSQQGDIDVFHLMLATTPIADRIIFDVSNEPAEALSEDDILDMCREVEKNISVYCFGLIEVDKEDPEEESAVVGTSGLGLGWYGRKYDKVHRFMIKKRLRFVHRTASDFLTDTASGARILDFDASSSFDTDYRLLKARLARLALFADQEETSSYHWISYLRRVRLDWTRTNELAANQAKDWLELVQIAKELADSGRLLAGGKKPGLSTPLVDNDFLKLLSCHGCLGVRDDIWEFTDDTVSRNDKSEILLGLCESLFVHNNHFPLATFSELLRADAGSDSRGWVMNACESKYFPLADIRTPWQSCLLSVYFYLNSLKFRYHRTTEKIRSSELAVMVQVVCLFLSSGATLDDVVNIPMRGENFELGRNPTWHINDFLQAVRSTATWMFASVPAYIIVKALAETVHRSCSLSGEGLVEEQRQNLEQALRKHRSSTVCRGLALVVESGGQFKWFEATDEMLQLKLGGLLRVSVERELMRWSSFGGDNHDDGSTATDGAEKTFESMLHEKSWKVKVRGSESAIIEYLEELGLVARIDKDREFHTVKEWVAKHNEKSPSWTAT